MNKLFSIIFLGLGLILATAQQVTPVQAIRVSASKSEKVQTEKKAPVAKSIASKSAVKMKKDGTPDKRYKANQHLKKDGTPDKRFKTK